MTHKWRIAGWTAAILAVITLGILYGMVDPASHIFPRCPFRAITGFDCAGCGSQRAIHHLLNGDLTGAWHDNALLVIMLPLIVVLYVAQLLRFRFPKFYNTMNSAPVIWSVFAIVALWWVGRNIWLR